MTMQELIFITNWVHPVVVDRLRADFRVDMNADGRQLGKEELMEKAREAAGLMVFMPDSLDDALLAGCPRLRIVAGALKGYDNFDVQACTRRGIWFSNVPDLLTEPTAELVIGLIIGLGRNVLEGDRYIRSGAFRGWEPRFYGTGLAGRTIGIIGLGAVGRSVVRRLQGFRCSIVYSDSAQMPASFELDYGVTRVSLPELLRASDYVLPLVPLKSETKHLLDAERIAQMKPGSFLVNCCRGSVVDEQAVQEALSTGHLQGYAADVFEMEDWLRQDRPDGIAPKLLNQPKTLFTPHLGSAVDEVRKNIALEAADNIREALQGKRPRGAVNCPGC
jgi:phosphonate dehydrogenase